MEIEQKDKNQNRKENSKAAPSNNVGMVDPRDKSEVTSKPSDDQMEKNKERPVEGERD